MRIMSAFLDEDPETRALPSAHESTAVVDAAFRAVLFTDLVGHTEMMSRLGDERGRAVLREHEAITREVLKQHAGTEVKTMGDGFMASFASVTKAVECAVALQRAFADRNANLPSPAHGRGTSAGGGLGEGITRIDHVVMRVPSARAVIQRMEDWFGVPTKRTFERGGHTFAFMRPGDVTIEVIGPTAGGEPGTGRIAGLAFEVDGIDELAASLKAKGYPIGEPHPALQGGRIVSVHHSGACGVPLAFIDFTDSPGPPKRDE